MGASGRGVGGCVGIGVGSESVVPAGGTICVEAFGAVVDGAGDTGPRLSEFARAGGLGFGADGLGDGSGDALLVGDGVGLGDGEGEAVAFPPLGVTSLVAGGTSEAVALGVGDGAGRGRSVGTGIAVRVTYGCRLTSGFVFFAFALAGTAVAKKMNFK